MTISSYLAAVGSVRAWETKLLREVDVEKMLGARTFAEAFQVLSELDFSAFLSEVRTPEEFEKVLQMALYETKLAFTRMLPDVPALDLLWLFADLHNAKVLLKNKLLENEDEAMNHLLLPYGSRSTAKMRLLRDQESAEFHDQWIKAAFAAAQKRFQETQDPLMAENVLDRIFLEKILEVAAATKNHFLINFIRHTIDANNILTAFRFLVRNHVQPPFLAGGTLQRSDLAGEDIESFGEKLPYHWRELFQKGKADYRETGSFALLENILHSAVADFLERAKFVIDGPEPLIAYFWRKQYDAKIIRTILVGKRANLPEATIRHVLPKLP